MIIIILLMFEILHCSRGRILREDLLNLWQRLHDLDPTIAGSHRAVFLQHCQAQRNNDYFGIITAILLSALSRKVSFVLVN